MTEEYNLYPLHVFRVVARLGSVTRAAQELYISQPAVSSHLKALEVRYQAPLFERTPRGMLLTPAGEAAAEYANRVFALLEDMSASIEAAGGDVKGKVTVAASSTPGAYLVPRMLRRFQDRYPNAEPILMVGDSSEVLSWLHDYRVPLGVVGETAMEAGLVREEIGRDELRLVVSADDSLGSEEEIRDEHFAGRMLFLREQGSSTRVGAEALLGSKINAFRRIAELNSSEAIKQSVAVGLGVAILSSWATELEEKAGLLTPVTDERLRQERRFYVVRREDRFLSGVSVALWHCLTTCSYISNEGKVRFA